MEHPDYMEMSNELIQMQIYSNTNPAFRQFYKMFMGEFFVLNYLSEHEDNVYPKDLSESMGVSTARIAVVLNQLEKKQLVRRRVDPRDNRRMIVDLTEEGQQKIEQAQAQFHAYVCAKLEELGPEDAQAYVRISKKLQKSQGNWFKIL